MIPLKSITIKKYAIRTVKITYETSKPIFTYLGQKNTRRRVFDYSYSYGKNEMYEAIGDREINVAFCAAQLPCYQVLDSNRKSHVYEQGKTKLNFKGF